MTFIFQSLKTILFLTPFILYFSFRIVIVLVRVQRRAHTFKTITLKFSIIYDLILLVNYFLFKLYMVLFIVRWRPLGLQSLFSCIFR